MPPSAKVKILDTFTGLCHEQVSTSEADCCPDQDFPRSHHHPSSVPPPPPLASSSPREETEILADGADFAILRLIQERPATATTALATLSSTHPPVVSMVVCERGEDELAAGPTRLRLQEAEHGDMKERVSLTEAAIIGTNDYYSLFQSLLITHLGQDPIEGRDSEFDVELSSASSVHSYSLTATLERDEDLLEWSPPSSSGPSPASSPSSEQDPLISTEVLLPTAPGTTATSGTIYGKVVKSIQRSIRKIFHCGRENLSPHHRQPDEGEEGRGVASMEEEEHKDGNSGDKEGEMTPMAAATTTTTATHSLPSPHPVAGQSDIPMSLIRHSAVSSSPITSVSSTDPVPLVTSPIHKTLLIDVAYGVR